MNYQEFLKRKSQLEMPTGTEVQTDNAKLFDFQRDLVNWALTMKRSAIFAQAEITYKAIITNIDILKAQLMGFQSINRHLEDN